MNLALIYEEIEKRVSKVDFTALWKGFYPLKFALYTDKECFFDGRYIEKTDIFCANTSIKFNGEEIAIWNINEEPWDMDILSASIIHEMFHAFQEISGECRYADEKEAPFKYCYSIGNLSAKHKEASYIRDILERNDHSAYSKLLALRKMRSDRYPYEYEYEARIEQIEGTAKFVEVNARIKKCSDMEESLNRYWAETHRIIDTAVRKNKCVLKGKYPLISVNIWDARCEGNYVTSNHFLMYDDGEKCKTIYGNFVIEVDADYNVLTVLTQ